MKAAAQYGAYPVVMTVCVVLHLGLVDHGTGSLVATYVPVTLGALLVTLLELYLPYRRAWRPSQAEVAHDSLFLTAVRVVLPKCLSFATVLVIFHWLQGETWSLRAWWPSYWPVGWQALWMVMLADWMRYWLHRLSHEWEPLWRFHAVHHAPHKLYWLNVGRFHPVDKALQFLFDTLPFVALGVGEDVLSLYFVGYAVNGFFQHCNIDVRLGLLNYLISGPELHRWHHSVLMKRACASCAEETARDMPLTDVADHQCHSTFSRHLEVSLAAAAFDVYVKRSTIESDAGSVIFRLPPACL